MISVVCRQFSYKSQRIKKGEAKKRLSFVSNAPTQRGYPTETDQTSEFSILQTDIDQDDQLNSL